MYTYKEIFFIARLPGSDSEGKQGIIIYIVHLVQDQVAVDEDLLNPCCDVRDLVSYETWHSTFFFVHNQVGEAPFTAAA